MYVRLFWIIATDFLIEIATKLFWQWIRRCEKNPFDFPQTKKAIQLNISECKSLDKALGKALSGLFASEWYKKNQNNDCSSTQSTSYEPR